MKKLELGILVPPLTHCVTLYELVQFAIHKIEPVILTSQSCWEVNHTVRVKYQIPSLTHVRTHTLMHRI